jgi:hypothetical protein
MALPDSIIRHYEYAAAVYPEATARRCRIEMLYAATRLLPSKCTAEHKKIIATIGRSVRMDHITFWECDGMPIVISEQYPPPDTDKLGLSGTVHIVVPQRYSIYRPDTYMVLHTLPKYRDALVKFKCRIESASTQ